MNKRIRKKMINCEQKLLNKKEISKSEYKLYKKIKSLDFFINNETYGKYIGWQQEGFYPMGESYLNEKKVLLKRKDSRF